MCAKVTTSSAQEKKMHYKRESALKTGVLKERIHCTSIINKMVGSGIAFTSSAARPLAGEDEHPSSKTKVDNPSRAHSSCTNNGPGEMVSR